MTDATPGYIHTTAGYKRIRRMFAFFALEEYGSHCLVKNKMTKVDYLWLQPVYREEEASYVMPWMSGNFNSYMEMLIQAIGFGKLAFHRTASRTLYQVASGSIRIIIPASL